MSRNLRRIGIFTNPVMFKFFEIQKEFWCTTKWFRFSQVNTKKKKIKKITNTSHATRWHSSITILN